jgi:drug/metabolite transporter (DMT)-like permease
MAAVALGLAASCCWGTADFLGGVTTRHLSALWVVLLSQVIGLFALVGLVVAAGQGMPHGTELLGAAGAGLTGAVGLGCFYRALALGKMSVVAPITATGAIVPVIVGLGDGDQPGGLQAAGMVAAVIGILLATQDGDDDAEGRRRSRTSIALAFAAAVSIGLGLVAIDRAADAGVLSAAMWARVVSVGLLLSVVAFLRPPAGAVGPRIRSIAAIGLFDAGATTLYAWATTEGLLSVVGVISSLYPVVTILLARTILNERIRRIQTIGVACALSGVAVVGAGG